MPEDTQKTLADETDQLVHIISKCGIDGVIGGFPCQDISIAGNKKGIQRDTAGKATTRSGLFWEMAKTVRMVRPKYWIMENVAELLNGYLGGVLEEVASCGYDAEWDCVGAGTVGAPHHRARIYILAYNTRKRVQRMFPKAIQRQPEFSRFKDIRSIEDLFRRPDFPEPIIRRTGNGVRQRLHAIGNGNPPCVIREITRGLR